MSIVSSTMIAEAIRVCQTLKYGRSLNFNFSLHSDLLQDLIDVAVDCPEKPKDFNVKLGMPLAKHDSICLTSGGADSTIFWHLMGKPKGIYINMGQPYWQKETKCLQDLGVDFDLIDVAANFSISSTSDWKHIIPGRNFLFLTTAAEFVKDEGTIYFSVISGEGWWSGKGDKSQVFVRQWQKWYYSVTGKAIFVRTMIDKTKGQWLDEFTRKGFDTNIIRHKTVTCFSSGEKQCGRCQACIRKYLSFIMIGEDISEDFETHPMIGGKEFVEKYKKVLPEALEKKDFSHYSEARCKEDLFSIQQAEALFGC